MLIRPVDAFERLVLVGAAAQRAEAGAAALADVPRHQRVGAGPALVESDGADVWIGGHLSACIEGTLRL